MTTIQTIVLSAHTIIALLIIALVLLQKGKGAEAGAALDPVHQIRYLVQKVHLIFSLGLLLYWLQHFCL